MDRKTMREINKEIRKCQQDPVYFITRYFKVNGHPMILTSAQKQMLREYVNSQKQSV